MACGDPAAQIRHDAEEEAQRVSNGGLDTLETVIGLLLNELELHCHTKVCIYPY